MDATIKALGGILLGAVPTFFLVIILHFYLKKVFFEPMGRILAERDAATTGARAQAAASLARADKLAAEHAAAIRAVRVDVYQQNEQEKAKLRSAQAEALQAARGRVRVQVEAAKRELRKEADAALVVLKQEAESLATRIAQQILPRRAA